MRLFRILYGFDRIIRQGYIENKRNNKLSDFDPLAKLENLIVPDLSVIAPYADENTFKIIEYAVNKKIDIDPKVLCKN